MPVGRRGLVVPQNTFLENVVRRSNGLHSLFVLGNAQILENPIVYSSDGFCKFTGFTRAEVMKKNCDCSFLFGQQTDPETVRELHNALQAKTAIQKEFIAYKKDGTPMWVLFHLGPIKNEKGEVMLFLVTLKDITEYKDPIVGTEQTWKLLETCNSSLKKDYNGGPKGWARLNKTLTRHKSVLVAFKQKTTTQRNAQQITSLMSLNDELLPDYKLDVPHTPPRVILHYTGFKTTWDWVILFLTLYTTISVPFLVCFAFEHTAVSILDLLVDWMFLADIALNFHTTYVGKDGEVIDDLKMIRWNYIRSWFFLDLVSSLPYGVLAFITKDSETNATTLLGFLKVFRLLRLGRVARKIDKYLEYGASTFFLLMLSFCLVAHWMACIFYLIATGYDNYEHHGWLQVLGRTVGRPYKYINGTDEVDPETGPTIASKYVSALYYTLTSLTTIGFGNIAPNTTAEKMFGCITMLLGAILFSLIFGQVSAILNQAQKNTAKYHSIIDNMKQFSKLYKLPTALATRTIDFFMSTWAMNKGIDTDEVLKYCPKDLQADICVHLNRIILENNPAFRDANTGVKRAIARNFWITHVAPGDRIIHHGESLDVLYFIARGSLEVKQGETVVGLLGENDVFGDNICHEPTVGQSAVDVIALTYCDLHWISRDALIEVLEFYPEFANKFTKNLVLSYNLRDEIKIRKRTPRLEIANEDQSDRPPSVALRPRRQNRKLSLVEELAQNYEFDESHVDGGDTSDAEIDMMVIPKTRTKSMTSNIVRARPDVPESGVDVLSSLSEMKGEVRREIEVMNMKMTQLEEQISTILTILKSQGHLHSPRGYGSPRDSLDKGRMSSTSYLNDTSHPVESPPREEKDKEEPLPEWLAPTGSPVARTNSVPDWDNTSTQAQEDNSAQAANLLNNQAGQSSAADADPRILQTLGLFKMGKK
ncbi:voltage-gated delayed rectifier potassium channel KCNH5-like isoform X3 [Oculina patagonica]